MNLDDNLEVSKNGNFDSESIFPPLSTLSKMVHENGNPKLKSHLPEWKDLSKEQKDLLLALEIVSADLSKAEEFEPVKFGLFELRNSQIKCKIKGKDVCVIVKVARVPHKPSYFSDINDVRNSGGGGGGGGSYILPMLSLSPAEFGMELSLSM